MRHSPGASELVVRLHRGPGRLRVTVCDHGPGGVVRVGRAGSLDTHERGLSLVSRLARRWGTEALEQGTCVWFGLELAEGPKDESPLNPQQSASAGPEPSTHPLS